MDLDYKSVKALSSPTRLQILQMVLEEEATTTKLSEEMDKSKSTVSSHLKVLADSGLLEKDEEEGRRRVVYRPTDKAQAIAEGRERKVKFSVISSALAFSGGIYFLSGKFKSVIGYSSNRIEEKVREQGAGSSSGGMGTMDAESGRMAAQSTDIANQTSQNTAEGIELLQNLPDFTIETALGLILVFVALMALVYAYIHFGIREEK